MADVNAKNRKLFIMKYEHQKLVAKAQMQAKEIKIIELGEEIERCKEDIKAQQKVLNDMDENIKQQNTLIEEENMEIE